MTGISRDQLPAGYVELPDGLAFHVAELRKQYEVVQIAPTGPYPDDLDAILAILPSSLGQPEMEALRAAMLAGTPTLLLDDPLPMFNPQLSPRLPRDAERNPFTSQGQPPAPPKGDLNGLGQDGPTQ